MNKNSVWKNDITNVVWEMGKLFLRMVHANTDHDIKCVISLAKELEGEKYKVKLFIPDRNDTKTYPKTTKATATK